MFREEPGPGAADGTADPEGLLISEHLATLGTLVAGVAHEINNPITYVLGNLKELERLCGAMRSALDVYRGRLRDSLGDDGRALIEDVEGKLAAAGGVDLLDEIVGDACEGALRIRDLVRDLLDLSHGPQRSTAPVRVEDVLDSTLRLVSRPLGARTVIERDYRATRVIEGDRAQLGQVFLNLLKNAIDACRSMDGPGRIGVRTRDDEDGVCIELADSGPGVSADDLERVFTPFFTTKKPGQGTGLGLYISRRIIDDHGGSIELRAGTSGGTIARVRLPGGST